MSLQLQQPQSTPTAPSRVTRSWKDGPLGNGGWFLFLIGFFLIAIPWYVGLLTLMCGRSVDYREKPGLIACTIAAILGTIAIITDATMNS